MDIRNVMEDRVLELIEDICNEDEKSKNPHYCTSRQCRLDAACYVLNRIPQKYVTSSRGFAYLQNDFNDNMQLQVDMVTLAHEGLSRVTSIQRSFYDGSSTDSKKSMEEDFYFFLPTIRGRLFNSVNFDPIIDVDVSLSLDGVLVPMMDTRWTNPYTIVTNTPGTYLFWPHPIASTGVVEKTFELVISVSSTIFEPYNHYCSLTVQSEPARNSQSRVRDHLVSDLFLIPRGSDTAMDLSVNDDENLN